LEVVAVALGGAFGAVARFSLGNMISDALGTDFPYSILIVNVLGSFLMGVGFELLVENNAVPAIWRSLLLVGFLGAFTTFSTFSSQVLGLLETGRIAYALIYILSSVCLSVLAVAVGIFVSRQLTS